MSSFRDRVIESVKDYYEEEIDSLEHVLKVIVEIINLYINHQDKVYQKIFKEDVYCDLEYNSDGSPISPIVVLKSKKNESVKLRVASIPSFSYALSLSDPENDHYTDLFDTMRDALYSEIELDEDKIESIENEIYFSVLEHQEVNEDGEPIDEDYFDFSYRYAIDDFFYRTSNKEIAERFSGNNIPDDIYEIPDIADIIESKRLHNEIFFLYHYHNNNFSKPEQYDSMNENEILKEVADKKYASFGSLMHLSNSKTIDPILKYILDTDNIFLCTSISAIEHIPELIDSSVRTLHIDRRMFKGVVKNISVCVQV